MSSSDKTTQEDKKNCTLCKKLGLRPLTRDNILFFYAPIHGMISYAALSINVMNPSIALRILPKRDVTNFLLIHTLFGTTLYIYSRPHLQSIAPKQRVLYGILGSTLFSMGSVLVWAVVRSAVPKHNGALTALGCASAYVIAKVGYNYIQHVDSLAVAKK